MPRRLVGRGIRDVVPAATPGRRRRRAARARPPGARAPRSGRRPARIRCAGPAGTGRGGARPRSACTQPRWSAPPTHRANVWHGVRGIVTSTVQTLADAPAARRSGRAFTSMPSVRRFSPKKPGRQGAAELALPERGILVGVRVQRLVETAVVLAIGLHVRAARRIGRSARGRRARACRSRSRRSCPASGRSCVDDADGDEAGHPVIL